ncbi:hypothetical protein C8Q75DRAFT_805350 [Abortiporus biennis]|nr:hypothetical protein C8Q75DRAFT_805350 [Abortiporus biennis]
MAPLVDVPNPSTPFAWLPADIATQVQNANLFVVAIVGAWTCNFLMSLHEEIRMLTTSERYTIPDFCYLLARVTTMGYLVSSTIFVAREVEHCQTLMRIIGCFGGLAMPINSLLLFHRVRAVFHENRPVIVMFAILWLSTFSCLTVLIGTKAAHIGPTKFCIESAFVSSNAVGLVVIAIYDTLLYFAISARLTLYDHPNMTLREWLKMFLTGRGLHKIARTLFTSGQLYYLATVAVNIVTMVMILDPKVSEVYRAMIAVLDVAVQNAMACLVYRQIKIGMIKRDSMPITLTGMQFSPVSMHPISSSTNMKSILESRDERSPIEAPM